MKLADAERLAAEIADWLADGCSRIEVVGSVRRRKSEVRDLEFVVLPALQGDLMGGQAPALWALDQAIARAMQQRRWRWDEANPANGARLKRLWVPSEAVKVELWIADSPGNYGNITVIRTGDADFSRLLMTPRPHGLMPAGMREQGGYLWRGAERLDCPDESAFFAALGIDPVPEPAARDEALARRLARQVLHGN